MKKKPKNRFWINWFYLLLIIASIFSNVFTDELEQLLYLYPDYNFSNNTEIHFIDVGQGDAIAIKFSSGEVMLIDSGIKSHSKKLMSYLDNIVIDSDNTIDFLVLTHIDADHIGNMFDIINRYRVNYLYRPPVLSSCEGGYANNSNAMFDNLISKAIEKKITLVNNSAGNILKIGNDLLEWFAPNDFENKENLTTNNYSPVIKLSSGNFSALFTGDIDSSIETEVINYYDKQLDVDILKVAHHGSATSNSLNFLQNTSPDYAVISAGENSYGHPSNELFERFIEYDVTYNKHLYENTYVTKDLGNIYLSIGNNIDIKTIKNIDDYAYIDYYIYSIIAVLWILFLMGLPYYRDIYKYIIFFFRNKEQERIQKRNKIQSDY